MKASDFTEAELDRIMEIAVQAKKDYQEVSDCLAARAGCVPVELDDDKLWLRINRRLNELAMINLDIPVKKPIPDIGKCSLYFWERPNIVGIAPFGQCENGSPDTWEGCDIYTQEGLKLRANTQEYKDLCAGKEIVIAGRHFQLKEMI